MNLNFVLNGGRKHQFLLLAVVGLFLTLFQVSISQELQCYDCVFTENTVGGIVSSATCENSPALDELENATTIIEASGPGIRQLLTRMNRFKGIPLTSPDASEIINLDPYNSVLVENTTTVLYCLLAKLNVEGIGRVVVRGAAEVEEDLGATICDNTLPPDAFVGPFPVRSSNICLCKTDRCNGRDINGGADTFVERSISLFLLSIGIAILGASS